MVLKRKAALAAVIFKPNVQSKGLTELFAESVFVRYANVELFETDLQAEREKAFREIAELKRQLAAASREADEIKRAGQYFFQLINQAG